MPYFQNNDVDLKKWALCVLNKMNLMSMEGVFRMDVALSKIYNKGKDFYICNRYYTESEKPCQAFYSSFFVEKSKSLENQAHCL